VQRVKIEIPEDAENGIAGCLVVVYLIHRLLQGIAFCQQGGSGLVDDEAAGARWLLWRKISAFDHLYLQGWVKEVVQLAVDNDGCGDEYNGDGELKDDQGIA